MTMQQAMTGPTPGQPGAINFGSCEKLEAPTWKTTNE